jgi:hypothetical protein
MTKLTDAQVRIAAQHRDYYLRRSAIRPSLYVTNDNTITVGLPIELLEFANRAAGHSGYNAGARAVGIRKTVSNANVAIRQIFDSVESLVRFIESSECDYEYPVGAGDVKVARKAIEKAPEVKFVAAREEFWSKFNADTLKGLRAKYGTELVNTAMEKLTLTEMQNLFGM